MNLNRIYLKIKIKSLAVESRMIRHEERKLKKLGKGPETIGLTLHRKSVVRKEARATLIAYGYLRGKSYEAIEPGVTTTPDWAKVKSMVTRYGTKDQAAEFDSWLKAVTLAH